MKEINKELLERYRKHRGKNHSITNLIVKIILFVLLVAMIRFFGNGKESKFRNIFKSFSKENKTEILK